MSDAHYPVRRVLERVDALPGVRPLRCMLRRGAVRDAEELRNHLKQVAAQLDVVEPTVAELRKHAEEHDDQLTLATLSEYAG